MTRAPADSMQVLLTASDVKKLEDEFARMSAEIAEIDARKHEIEAKRDSVNLRLNQIRELMTALGLEGRLSFLHTPTGAEATVTSNRSDGLFADIDRGEDEPHRSPWMNEIISQLKVGPYESLTSGGLRAAIEAGHLANALKASDKGYYHSVRRLALSGKITKEFGRLFTKEGIVKYKADGCPKIQSDEFNSSESGRKSPMADEIIAFIEISGGSARAGDIVSHLLTVDQFSGPVGRNKSSAYNVLGRLVDRHQLARLEGGVYRLPETNEASDKAEAQSYPLKTGDQTGAV